MAAMPRRSRPGAAAVLLAALALGTAACGSSSSGDDSQSAPTVTSSPASPTASGSGSATASASPAGAADALRTSYPRAGFTVTSLPRRARGATREALKAYLRFEDVTHTSLRTARVPASLRTLASPALVKRYDTNAAYQRSHDIRYSGSTTISVRVAKVSPQLAALRLCLDGTATRQVVKGAPKALDGLPRERASVVLTNTDGRWVVTEYTGTGEAC